MIPAVSWEVNIILQHLVFFWAYHQASSTDPQGYLALNYFLWFSFQYLCFIKESLLPLKICSSTVAALSELLGKNTAESFLTRGWEYHLVQSPSPFFYKSGNPDQARKIWEIFKVMKQSNGRVDSKWVYPQRTFR